MFTNDVVNMFATLEVFKDFYKKNIKDNVYLNLKFKSICLLYLNRGFEVEFLNNLTSVNQKCLHSDYSFNLIQLISIFKYARKENIPFSEIKYFLNIFKYDFQNDDKLFSTTIELFEVLEKKDKNLLKEFCLNNSINLKSLEDLKVEQNFSKNYILAIQVAVSALIETESFIDLIHGVVSVGGDTDSLATIAGALGELFYLNQNDIDHYFNQVKPFFKPFDRALLESFKSLY